MLPAWLTRALLLTAKGKARVSQFSKNNDNI